jgi:hypothetical protein
VAPTDFPRVAGDLAPVLLEYGALFLEQRTYRRGNSQVTAALYRMKDPTGAYGVFTFLRTEGMTGGRFGEHSAVSSDRALVMVGDLVLQVSGANLAAAAPELNGLVAQLYPKARLGPLPTVGDYLPARGLLPNTRRYLGGPQALARSFPVAGGDWLGFSDGAEAEMGRYRLGGEDVALLVAIYPTPQLAAQRLSQVEQVAASAGSQILARRSVSLIAVAAGRAPRQAMDALVGSIRYESDVTWNEPGYSATDPTVPEIVLGAIYGTGGILLLAFLSGLAFGVARVAIKRFLPGKVFDRPAAVEIIQLGLTSKPIEAKDFY